MALPTPRTIQRTYLVLTTVTTLATSFIWGVNTLFATGIVYSVKTWTAALILFAPISPRLKVEEVK